MSVRYQLVNWNRQKRLYDLWVGLGTLASVGGFTLTTLAAHPTATVETALIRGLGFAGFLLLTVILAIGPASRLDQRFLPLLYNRRHLGVTVGLLGLAHAGFVVFQYHALGNLDPLASVMSIPAGDTGIPFEWYGVAALAVLFLMAATSHDYWLSALTPPVWKALHMLVYPAYLALLAHIGLGLGRSEPSGIYLGLAASSAVLVAALHVAAGLRERRIDRDQAPGQDWVDAGPVESIPEGRAVSAMVAGERVAVFRHQGRLAGLSGVCRHQNGPLAEGKIIDGCVTCPWHGYQYRPADGKSPPPFTDVIPTFNLAVRGGRVWVDPVPNPPGTTVEPIPAGEPTTRNERPFYVGYLPVTSGDLRRFLQVVPATILLLVVSVMVTFAAAQRSFDQAVFEYREVRSVEGTLRGHPYPILEVDRPGTATRSRYILAAAGKHGAQRVTDGLDGQRVRIDGSFAYRDNLSVLEIAGVVGLGPSDRSPAAAVPAGRYDLVGEIVDSKCYAGVMNPGRGPTHRGCAVRCVAGGMTPLFVVRDSQGATLEMILTDQAGGPLPQIVNWVGREIGVTGQVESIDEVWFLRIDPASIRPAP